MNALHKLLTNRWIIRSKDPDAYYEVKDNLLKFESFVKEKLGYNIIQNQYIIKLEKIPGDTQPFMGISDFTHKSDYVILCLVLMFLEDLEIGEQFVLAGVIDYVKRHSPQHMPLDWTIYSHRKSMMRVLKFCANDDLIKITDGDEQGFTNNLDAVEVLYENTGLSKYFMRRFSFEIEGLKTHRDFQQMEWNSDNTDRGLIRRHRVYRKLILNPAVYFFDKEDADYDYIKKQRSVIKNDLENYLSAELDIHHNGAFVLLNPKDLGTRQIPNRKNITDIAFLFCLELTHKVKAKEILIGPNDLAVLSMIQWEQLIKAFKDASDHGFSKAYRDMTHKHLVHELTQTMHDYAMIKPLPKTREIMMLPAVGKFHAVYPSDYLDKLEER